MAKYHITPKGPALCHANPDKPGGRACRYSSEGHFQNEKEAEAAFVAKEGLEQSSTSLSKKTLKKGRRDKPSKAAARKLAGEEAFKRTPLESLPARELQHFRDYQNGANWDINRALRRGELPSGEARNAMGSLERLIEKSTPVDRSTRVWRSLDTGKGETIKIPSKGQYKDPAFLSCSTSEGYIEDTLKNGVDEYSDYPSDTILSIELPKGSKAFAAELSDPDYAEEQEVVLNRGSTLEVISDTGYVNGVRRVEAKLVR